jgi:hypothetical protein
MPTTESIVSSLCNPSRPTFLFGCTPPSENATEEEAIDIASKFAARGRVLAVDGYIVYDVQDESVRTDVERPFRFRKLQEPSAYARHLSRASHKECVVYKAVPCMPSREHFDVWLDQVVEQDRHRAINIVGAPSSKDGLTYNGPSTKEACQIVKQQGRIKFGAVCIAERHLSKGIEHEIMAKKVAWGAEWFITQGIYDPAPMTAVINAYSKLCREQAVVPKKIILTFTPCGRRKTLEFIRWLGMHVPAEAEAIIFQNEEVEKKEKEEAAAKQAGVELPKKKKKRVKPVVEICCELLCAHLRTILEQTAGSGVPIGINVESVSGYKDEIDATHELFRALQAILLDGTGSPWVMTWSRLHWSFEATAVQVQHLDTACCMRLLLLHTAAAYCCSAPTTLTRLSLPIHTNPNHAKPQTNKLACSQEAGDLSSHCVWCGWVWVGVGGCGWVGVGGCGWLCLSRAPSFISLPRIHSHIHLSIVVCRAAIVCTAGPGSTSKAGGDGGDESSGGSAGDADAAHHDSIRGGTAGGCGWQGILLGVLVAGAVSSNLVRLRTKEEMRSRFKRGDEARGHGRRQCCLSVSLHSGDAPSAAAAGPPGRGWEAGIARAGAWRATGGGRRNGGPGPGLSRLVPSSSKHLQ